MPAGNGPLILSLFPGIGLLDRGFEDAGFCVVRGPDKIWGGDIVNFHPPRNVFAGVIGGPPCQDFSKLRHSAPDGNGLSMLAQYRRIVTEANPTWWLMENVPQVPDLVIEGFSWFRMDVKATDFGCTQQRLRHFQYGATDGKLPLLCRNEKPTPVTHRCVTASDDTTPIPRLAAVQGLPVDFSIPAFTQRALRSAIGNGVPYPVALAVATAIESRIEIRYVRPCLCRCGRLPIPARLYATGACRKRAFDRRKRIKEPFPLDT